MTQPRVPPAPRSATALGLLRGVAAGKLMLQRCDECGTVQYPPREVCGSCLGAELVWSEVDNGGRVLATTLVRVSNDEFFRERLPWPVGLVRADCGPPVVTHLAAGLGADDRIRIEPRADTGGRPVLVALPPSGADPLPEFRLPVRGSSAWVTETRSETGRAVVNTLLANGIDVVSSRERADLVLDTRP